MKSLIIYFSQSGNTKAIARAVHRGMEPVVETCTLERIDRVPPEDAAHYDLIGFGSPVWAGVPPHVERFIRRTVPRLDGKLAFAFSTHGAKPERFAPAMIRLLMEKGLVVVGYRGWFCSTVFPFVPFPYLTDGHPDSIDLQEAAAFGRQMAEVAARVSAGETGLIPPVPAEPPPRAILPPEVPMRLNLEKCAYPACRLCMDHCRLKMIDVCVSPPVFPKKSCRTCFFCEYICPTGAIEADYGPRAEFEMKAAHGLFSEAIDRAEAEGRFRRLVPVEKVGWNTPWYKAHNTHPRWVIPEEDL